MQLLASGNFVKNQIVKVGLSAYGIQSHFELVPEMFNVWMREDPDLQTLNREDLIRHFEDIKFEYEVAGKKLFNNFLDALLV